MIKHILFLFLLLLSLDCWGQQETGFVIFVDSVTPQTSFVNRGKQVISNKTNASSVLVTSRMGKFEATYDSDDENLRDGMTHCLRMAMDMWEDKMQFSIPVKFHVSATLNLSPSVEVKTIVNYSKISRNRSRVHSLYKQAHENSEIVDSIFVNSNIDWNYSRLYDISGGTNNITTAFLKQIAHILGFGISVTEVNGQIGFTINQTYSDFDDLVVNGNGNKLSSLARTGGITDLSNFLRQDIFFASNVLTNKLYSDTNRVDIHKTGKYFSSNDAGLMNYPQAPQSEPMKINAKLWSAIDSIGWSIKSYEREIVCNDLDQAGYGSAYLPHTFNLSGGGLNYCWRYQSFSYLTGQYSTKMTITGHSLSLNDLPVFSEDEIGPDMCVQSRIECEVVQDGITNKYTLPVFLELRPVFIDYNVSNVNCPTGSNYYSMDVTLEYYGAQSCQMSVCNEYAPPTNYYINGAGQKTIHVDSIFRYGQSFLDIKFSNEYGDNVKIIYLDNPCVFSNRLTVSPSYCINAELNGEMVMDSLVVRDNDEITFSLTCPSDVLGVEDKNISWQLCFPNDDGNEWSKMFGNGISSSFKLEKNFFTKNKYDYITKLFSWKVDEETGIVYNKGMVRAEIARKEGTKEVVEYPVRMEVLPWMPTVTILKYIELECPNGIWPYVELEITANNIKGGYVYTTDAAWLGATGEPFTDETPMPFHVVVDWGSMGCGYGCIVNNDYGILTSSPVFPNKEDTTICSISHEGLQIQQHGDMVTVNFPCNADEVTIVGISGKQYCSQKSISGLRTSLPKGIYLLNITYQGKKQVYIINKK